MSKHTGFKLSNSHVTTGSVSPIKWVVLTSVTNGSNYTSFHFTTIRFRTSSCIVSHEQEFDRLNRGSEINSKSTNYKSQELALWYNHFGPDWDLEEIFMELIL